MEGNPATIRRPGRTEGATTASEPPHAAVRGDEVDVQGSALANTGNGKPAPVWRPGLGVTRLEGWGSRKPTQSCPVTIHNTESTGLREGERPGVR